MAKMNEVKVPVNLSIEVHALGPLDGRHVIVIPNTDDEDTKQELIEAIQGHFIGAHNALNPDSDLDARAVVPLIFFGEVQVLGSYESEVSDG